MFWENIDQARQRLASSYMMYGNKPVRIHGVDEDGVYTEILSDRNVLRRYLSLDDPLWHDFRRHVMCPIFVNTMKGLFYVIRRPARTVVHGLSRQSSVCYVYSTSAGGFVQWDYQIDRLAESFPVDLSGAWEGRFPSFSVAMSLLLDDGLKAVAMSPQYAIAKKEGSTITVFKQMQEIGFVSPDSGMILLLRGKAFLREEFTEQVPDIMPIMEI